MGGGWVILAIVIFAGLASIIGQVVKARRESAAPRRRSGGQPESGRGGEFDKFLAEIERLRQKPPPAAVPVAAPIVVPVAKKTSKKVKRRVPDAGPPVAVPVAAPVHKPLEMPLPTITTSSIHPPTTPKSEQGKLLLKLLSNPQSVPAAFVLAEVFGPPKCKQNAAGGVPPAAG
jgi:hypothetical protein